ncbi:hypothetical protein PybrP1_004186 [[Pythium] brassicae (nom. inval.)]|nr:hypothetical protein PybrP1_004186 [[Pythium] brassicae (nom. inval.)]
MSDAGSPRKAAAPARAPRPERPELTEADIPDVIERLPKPDKAAHETAIAKIDAEIKKLQARTNVIRAEMDALKGGRGKYGEQIKAAKAVFSTLRAEKDNLIQQRNQITAKLKGVQDAKEATVKTQRSLRSALKFSSEEEFEREIASLRHQQETRSMALVEEKRIIKEIEALQQQKLQVAKFATEKDAVDKHSDSIKDIRALQAAKNLEIDAVQEKLSAQKLALDELYRLNEEENKADQFPVLADERTAIKKQLDDKFTALKELRNAFREENNKYYQNIRLVRFKKDLERKKEDEAKKAEYEAKLADYEKEMAKIHPYQDEMDLSDALIAYLENAFAKELKEAQQEAADAAKETVAVVELDGLKPLKRKEEDFMSFGGGKKKGKKPVAGPKKGKKEAKVAIALAQLDAFSTIGVVPPATVGAVSESLAAIKEKKVWFAAQTARPKKAAAVEEKAPSADAAAGSASPKKAKKAGGNKKFNAGDKNAFPSLGGGLGAEAPVAAPFSAWGPGIGPTAAVVPSAEDFPAVAAAAADDFPSAEDFPPVN